MQLDFDFGFYKFNDLEKLSCFMRNKEIYICALKNLALESMSRICFLRGNDFLFLKAFHYR
jgi:hypothetical protein